MVALNPYVLLVFLGLGLGYALVDSIKQPITVAYHQVVKAGHKVVHIVTFGKK